MKTLYKQLPLLFCSLLIHFVLNAQNKCDSIMFDAMKLQKNRQYQQAIDTYTYHILNCTTFNSEAFMNRGICKYAMRNNDAAKKDFDSAFIVTNDPQQTMREYAGFYLYLNKYDELYRFCQKLLQKDSTNAQAYFYMARCLWLPRVKIMQENNEQDFAQDTAIQSHLKNEISYLYDKAIYFDSIKNNKFYVSQTQMDAIKNMTSNYEFYFDRGLFRVDFGDFSGALNDYEKSIQIHPIIDAYHTTAYLAKKLNQKEKACNYIQIWATLYNPSENVDPFKKHQEADEFCKQLGIENKKSTDQIIKDMNK